jgi:ectoine hydroxylase-related dioxygenase (phytanoyl-CoA dioxygenase family)
MTRQLRRVDISEDFSKTIAILEEDAGVIVENFVSKDLLNRLVSELTEHALGFKPGMTDGGIKDIFCGARTKRFTGLAAKSPAFAEVIDHDLLHAWASSDFKNDYWMNTGQAMIIGPGSVDQPLHRDCNNWPIVHDLGRDGPQATLSMMLALSDFTAENGATRVVPGSHKWGDFSVSADPADVVQAIMPARSALLYTGKVIHAAGANTTQDQWRFGVHLSFVLGQLTPEEALQVTVPWSVAQHFSERVKAMLGYYSIRTFDGGWPILWTKDYRELRNQLDPSAKELFVTAGASLRLSLETQKEIIGN